MVLGAAMAPLLLQMETLTMATDPKNTSPQPAQRKPLTDEEIGQDPIFRAGVRFAEAKHNIKD